MVSIRVGLINFASPVDQSCVLTKCDFLVGSTLVWFVREHIECQTVKLKCANLPACACWSQLGGNTKASISQGAYRYIINAISTARYCRGSVPLPDMSTLCHWHVPFVDVFYLILPLPFAFPCPCPSCCHPQRSQWEVKRNIVRSVRWLPGAWFPFQNCFWAKWRFVCLCRKYLLISLFLILGLFPQTNASVLELPTFWSCG